MERNELGHYLFDGRNFICAHRSRPEDLDATKWGGIVILNPALIRNPINWIIVTLMLIIVGAAGHLVLSYFGIEATEAPVGTPAGDTPSTTPVLLRPDGTFAAISVGQ